MNLLICILFIGTFFSKAILPNFDVPFDRTEDGYGTQTSFLSRLPSQNEEDGLPLQPTTTPDVPQEESGY